MPKKKKGGKKKKSKKVKLIGNENPDQIMCRLLKSYEKNCVQCQSLPDPSLKKVLQDGKEKAALLTKFVLNPKIPLTPEDPLTTLEPLVMSLRQERYAYIKDLHIWDMPLNHVELASLALLLEKGFYPLRMIELMDCLIEAYPLRRLSLSFNLCSSLAHICFDYNEFGDAGSQGLCEGLEGNKTIISVSLNYCSLGIESGKTLGHIVSTTAVRELYVDGNDLQCEGLIELVKLCADHAEEESYQREQERARKEEEEAEAERRSKEDRYNYSSVVSDSDRHDKSASEGSRPASPEKSKKRKKGKKKKKSKEPPPVGPWICKLHIADNGIDVYEDNKDSFAPIVCLRLLRKLIANSECLEELDLEDNLIGDLGGREVMDALIDRKQAGLPNIKLRTTHRMVTDTFNSIVKLGAGLKKKKKGKKKKKK